MNKILEYFANKYTLIGIAILIISIFIFNLGYNKGKGDIIIIHDTTQIVDTTTVYDTTYLPAKIDTITIDTTKYKTYTSTYKMSREGYCKTWFIDSLKFFKWNVQEPKPIIITNVRYKIQKIPTINWKITIISSIICLIGGFVGGLLQ